VLDLEANAISEMESVDWLQMLPSLQELTLRGNAVCDQPAALRARVLRILPTLQLLDDESLRDEASPGAAAAAAAEEQQRRELRFVTEGIKKAEVPRVFDIAADGRATIGRSWGAAGSRPATAAVHSVPATALGGSVRPSSATAWPGRRTAWSSTSSSALRPTSRGSPATGRPGSGVRPGSSAGSRGSSAGFRPAGGLTLQASEGSSSDLTMGDAVICGVGALRRHKLNRSLRALDGAPPSTASSSGEVEEISEGGLAPLSNLDDLEAVLLEELRSLKLQQLLSGEDGVGDTDGYDVAPPRGISPPPLLYRLAPHAVSHPPPAM